MREGEGEEEAGVAEEHKGAREGLLRRHVRGDAQAGGAAVKEGDDPQLPSHK